MAFRRWTSDMLKQLRQRRQDLGMSQSDVDQKLGVAVGLVAKWEGDFRSPTSFNFYSWAHALGCDLVLVPRPQREEKPRARRRH